MSRCRTILLITLSLLIAVTSMLLRPLLATITTTLFKPTTTAISKMSTTSPASQKWRGVIVVGSGLAGLTAASELTASNIPVHMLERYPKPGGNSIKASSGINGAPTRFQAGPEIDMNFYADTVASVGKLMLVPEWTDTRESLVQALTGDSKSAVEWLVDDKGVDLSVVAIMGGHSVARTHRGAGKTPPGASLVLTLLKSLKESPLFELESECVVTRVLRQDKGKGRVEGVEYECTANGATTTKKIYGPVIFATGGFAGDSGTGGMLAKYRPDLASFPSTNSHRPGSQGLLTAVGAQLIDMEYVQVHPTAFVDPKDGWESVKFLAAEMLRGEGGVLLYGGKRFVNELKTRKVVVDAITALPSIKMAADEHGNEKQQWDITLLLDEATYQKTKAHVDFYIFKGLMRKTTIWALHDSEVVLATLAEYSAAANGRASDVLGRTDFGAWKLGSSSAPESDADVEVAMGSTVYVGTVTPATHFTMGGVVIDEFARAMEAGPDGNGGSEKASPIEGLWAAGEVTGGVHGENRLGGSSLLECVVFGRRAGRGAREYFHNL